MIKYQYQVLRYIHDQFTGEFANLGVILYSREKRFLGCQVVNKYGRLSDFFGINSGTFLIQTIRKIKSRISELSKEWVNENNVQALPSDLKSISSQILQPDDSALQLSETITGIDVDPAITLGELFSRIIEKYNSNTLTVQHNDSFAWKEVYKNYFDQVGITRLLKKHEVRTSKDEIRFDKAWKNGVWNCFQPLSFDFKSDTDIKGKAYKWSGIVNELQTSDEELNLYFLTTRPKDHPELKSFIREMLETTSNKLTVEVIEEEYAEQFANKVREDMKKSKLIEDDENPF